MTKRLLWIVIACATGCADDANVEGNYTMAITSRDNGCNLANWTVGEQASGISVMINQEGSAVNATITGIAGIYISAALGSNTYTGSVNGDEMDLELFGNRSQTSGNCAFTYNSFILGDADGDTMTGRIEYRAAGNGNPDCAAISGCLTYQDFNGTRPPT